VTTIFIRGNSNWKGHVGFYVGETAKSIKTLGGNQSNAVNIRHYSKSRVLGFRRPKVKPKAKNLRKYSRKLNLASKIKSMLKVVGAGFASFFGYEQGNFNLEAVETVTNFISNNSYWLVVVGLLSAYSVFKYIEDKTVEDYEEERYEPSRLSS
jgi:hypothetical protein